MMKIAISVKEYITDMVRLLVNKYPIEVKFKHYELHEIYVLEFTPLDFFLENPDFNEDLDIAIANFISEFPGSFEISSINPAQLQLPLRNIIKLI